MVRELSSMLEANDVNFSARSHTAHLRLGEIVCCSFPSPVAPLPDFSSLQQEAGLQQDYSLQCSLR